MLGWEFVGGVIHDSVLTIALLDATECVITSSADRVSPYISL